MQSQKLLPAALWGPELRENRSSFGTLPRVSLYLAVDSYPLISVIISRPSSEYMGFLSSLSHSSELIDPKERASWEPLIYSQSIGSTGNKLGLGLASEVGVHFVGLNFQPAGSDPVCR